MLYFRTSDEEAQNPQASQQRQRYIIEKAVLNRSDMPVIEEYKDVLTGKSPQRVHYQRMLGDARRGIFSHVFASVPDRFGCDDVEALRAIDEMTRLGIVVRFATHPDLDPADQDDRLYSNILFGMAKREAAVIARRCRGGMHSKLLNGGWPWHAPIGYINKERKLSEVNDDERLKHAKYKRWIELDSEQAVVWRHAWELLLTDRLTLIEICEKLYKQGYHLPDGRPFIRIHQRGRRYAEINRLSTVFHNWFYAGWVVVDNDWATIPPKTIRGEWEPMVSTEDFERGLAILVQRNHKPAPNKNFFYLLQGLVYLRTLDSTVIKLTCGTPNANRARGGVPYYCVPSSNLNFLCWKVDEQIPNILKDIQISQKFMSDIRSLYISDTSRFTS